MDFSAWLRQLEWDKLLDMAVVTAACLICITFHEMCHGLAALAMGDPTARRAGRLTLNPLRHVDLMGLIMLAVAKFGWAKPVPIDARNFRRPKLGMALTALAGPVSSAVLSAVGYVLYYVSAFYFQYLGQEWLLVPARFFYDVYIISAGLAAFNLLPVPPLDGSKVLFAVLPPRWYWKLMRYERYGMIALAVLLLTGVLDGPLTVLRDGITGLFSPLAGLILDLLFAIHF